VRRGRRRSRAPRSLRATRPGWCFVAILFGVGFAALNTGNNLLYLVFALMLAFLVLSGILSETSLRGIAVERVLPRELFAGAANPVGLRIRNRGTRFAAYALTIEDRLEPEAGTAANAGRVFVLRVGPGEAIERRYAFVPARRGEHAFSGLRVSTRFPFALFVKSLELEAEAHVLVYPALEPLPAPARARPARDASPARSGRAPSGDALAGVREFVAGDAAARIHWRRSVQHGRLVVGEREGESAGEIELLLQLAPELAVAVAEQRISRAATDLVAHLAAGHRVGLRSRGARFAPAAGTAHRRALLGFLARIELDAGAPP